MIARDRGEERVHSRWRPSVATGVGVGHRDPEPTEQLDPDLIEPELLDHRPAGSRRWLAVIGVVAAVVMAAIASHPHHRSTSPAGLPSTPSQWVEQWTAASLDSPSRVCRATLRAGARRRVQVRHRPLLPDVLRLADQQFFPHPPCAAGRPHRRGRGAAARPRPQVGLLHADPQPTSTAGGRRSTSFPADRSAHGRTHRHPLGLRRELERGTGRSVMRHRSGWPGGGTCSRA